MSSSVGAVGSVPEALEVEPGRAEVLLQQVDAADFVARLDRALVHARVADQLLEEVDGLEVVVHHSGSGVFATGRSGPSVLM
jgi:hypothetical protein